MQISASSPLDSSPSVPGGGPSSAASTAATATDSFANLLAPPGRAGAGGGTVVAPPAKDAVAIVGPATRAPGRVALATGRSGGPGAISSDATADESSVGEKGVSAEREGAPAGCDGAAAPAAGSPDDNSRPTRSRAKGKTSEAEAPSVEPTVGAAGVNAAPIVAAPGAAPGVGSPGRDDEGRDFVGEADGPATATVGSEAVDSAARKIWPQAGGSDARPRSLVPPPVASDASSARGFCAPEEGALPSAAWPATAKIEANDNGAAGASAAAGGTPAAPAPGAHGVVPLDSGTRPIAAPFATTFSRPAPPSAKSAAGHGAGDQPLAVEASEKNKMTETSSGEVVKSAVTTLGTGVARKPVEMPPFRPTSLSLTASPRVDSGVEWTTVTAPVVAKGEMPSPAAATAHQAVEAVFSALESVTADQRHPAVTLQFSVHGTGLAVRVERRGDAVQTTFHTDSPELRAALAHEWKAAANAPAPGAPRLAEPVFAAGPREPSFSSPRDPSSPQSHSQSEQRGAREALASVSPARRRLASVSRAADLPSSLASAALSTTRRLHTFA